MAFATWLRFGLGLLAQDCGIGIRARIWEPDRFGFVGSDPSSVTYDLCGVGIVMPSEAPFRLLWMRPRAEGSLVRELGSGA